ncbi:MAG: hypothetical protein SFX18_10520 [Pirellulales bacterium]|nr:hypothetical protein [Pirellulales bacterium]
MMMHFLTRIFSRDTIRENRCVAGLDIVNIPAKSLSKMLGVMRFTLAILLAAVAGGVSCGKRETRMQTFSIGSTAIDLPDFLETRIEDDTLVAFLPGSDFANLRFTVISVTKKDGQEVAGAGERLIRKEATERQAELHEGNNRVWFYVAEPACEGSAGSLMHYWYVGHGGHSLVVSCFVNSARSTDPLAQRVLTLVEPAIQSFRRDTK